MPDTMRPAILSVTPTLCRLFDIPPPGLCTAPPLEEVIAAAGPILEAGALERFLVYAPDAIGEHLLPVWPGLYDEIARIAPIGVALLSAVPPKTPVCYAAIFTGAPPETHGVRHHERPVLPCDTLFDAMLRAGRRVAIAAVADSSIDRLFRGRELDSYAEPYDPEVLARVHELLAADGHDLIVAYQQEYDDCVHAMDPLSVPAVAAARRHVASFAEIAAAAARRWAGRRWGIALVPDHGAHVDPATGKGTHGEAIPEDMHLRHHYGFGGPAPRS